MDMIWFKRFVVQKTTITVRLRFQLLGVIMKGAKFGRDRRTEVSGSCPVLKERRKSYYHGKYNREVFSVVILLACVATFMLRQGL